MKKILINCDIGERGIDNHTDLSIMPHIHVANIVCGGHAGDGASALFFAELAKKHRVVVAAHPSYPDRENFGRSSMQIGISELCDSLDAQMDHLPEAAWVKFHGALYNDTCVREHLADALAGWAARRRVSHVVTLGGSALANASRRCGLHVVAEFFAERRYMVHAGGCLGLVPRTKPYASIHHCGEALEQVRRFVETRSVQVVIGEHPDGSPRTESHPISGETVCVHSDSPISLQLVRGLAERGIGRKAE
jgi:UPF0271 protein